MPTTTITPVSETIFEVKIYTVDPDLAVLAAEAAASAATATNSANIAGAAASDAEEAKNIAVEAAEDTAVDRVQTGLDRDAAAASANLASEKAEEAAETIGQILTPQIYSNIFEMVPQNWDWTTSNFSGWGAPMGPRTNFDAIELRIRARATAITQIRIRIFDGDFGSTELFDEIINVNIPAFDVRSVIVDLGYIVISSNNLYLMYQCNQETDMYKAVTQYNSSFGEARLTRAGFLGDSTTIASSQQNIYFKTGLKKDVINAVDVVTADILTPLVLYAVQGVELNVNWDNVIFANHNKSDLKIDVTCTKGAQFEKGWRYTPLSSDAGTTTFMVRVYFDNIIIAEKTSTLITRASSSGLASIKVLCIGDSTTAGGQYQSLINTEYNTLPVCTFVGTQGTNPNKNEGRSSWRFSTFVGNTSPFWDSSISNINFSKYLTDNGITLTSADLITFHLGINDILYNDSLATTKDSFNQLTSSIRSAVANINICLLLPIPPSISQDAFGTNYANGFSIREYMDKYRELIKMYLTEYDTPAMRVNKIFVAQFNCNIDRTYNFPQSLVNANARNTTQVVRYTNGVHPDTSGYKQMGDSLWMFIKNLT